MLLIFKFAKSIIASFILLTAFTVPLTYADTFQEVCASCHNGGFKGFISGAPDINNKEAWQKYLDRDTLEEMLEILLLGTKEHKAKGGCSSCTDQQIIDAIKYILSKVKKQ